MAAALAIEHSTLRARAEGAERSARQLATQDPLTGVGNRSMLTHRLEHAASSRAGQRRQLAVAFIELDGFKAINDRHTHAGGDRVLQEVAERIRSIVRPHDTVVRWGRRVAERIAAVIAEPILFSGAELRVTASVGSPSTPERSSWISTR